MTSYYDIDDILAEEELIPCVTLFDFAHLSNLDPDHQVSHSNFAKKRQRIGRTQLNSGQMLTDRADTTLPEHARIKMPLWVIDQWATLGFVSIGLPKHYRRSSRERIESEPSTVDLRSKSERYFLSGMLIVDLVGRCSRSPAASISTIRGRNSRGNQQQQQRRNAHANSVALLSRKCYKLRKMLQITYSGERLRQTMDWTMNCIDDDVSEYTRKLTTLERKLFDLGAVSSKDHFNWKIYGSKRINVNPFLCGL